VEALSILLVVRRKSTFRVETTLRAVAAAKNFSELDFRGGRFELQLSSYTISYDLGV